ncbi:Uma2 family endonuclease [Chondromyces crocatus]|uniref:Putative restriction endonuclease domain-containing protein n=1 Tax=Chondromyces crocatus TaxID=52 RepID=A0A0K1ETU2_CHOCO|nr:Uma2 family endonuclease [Chondromyces crocatus]AKT44053.1 uncharacterized protein CMC5_082910 [Chondromyces crocatus]
MGQPAENQPETATYADLEAVPSHLVAELIGGVLQTFPRPGPAHIRVASQLGRRLGPFDDEPGGPGGWWILDEPELHLCADVLVPDLAGWRVERLPRLPEESFFELPPDWVCEVLSSSTAAHDRLEKMPVYAAAGVAWAWLIDPIVSSLEVFRLDPRGRWIVEQVFRGDASVRPVPFDALDLDLASLWATTKTR